MLVALITLLALTYIIIRLWLTRSRKFARRVRWDGGIRRLLPEMTYTATGFSNPVRVIFDAIFLRRQSRTRARRWPNISARLSGASAWTCMWWIVLSFNPCRDTGHEMAGRLAAMHHGRINAYAAYVLLALLAALAVGLLGLLW